MPFTPPSQNATTKFGVLIPLGIGLIIIGLGAPRALSQVAAGMDRGMLKSVALILTDVLRVGVFGGVVCVIIGLLRRGKK